jgi:hypothetical protein
MVSLHDGKEKKGFTKEGLIATKLDSVTGLPSDNGNITEYITKEQLDKLNNAKANFAKADYNPLANTFLQNMTSVVPRKLKINKIDGKLAVEGKTLPENIEEVDFIQLVAEYPKWQDTADKFMENNDKYKKAPTEISDQDQVAQLASKPTITSNLDSSVNAVSEIKVKAAVAGDPTKTITSIEILINGISELTVNNNDTATIAELNTYPASGNTILIRVTDSLSAKSEKTYSNVSFGSASSGGPLTESDLAGLNIRCTSTIPTTASCSFKLDSGVTLPSSFRIRIGTSGSGTTCVVASDRVSVSCPAVTISGSGTTLPIQVKLAAAFVATVNEYDNSAI